MFIVAVLAEVYIHRLAFSSETVSTALDFTFHNTYGPMSSRPMGNEIMIMGALKELVKVLRYLIVFDLSYNMRKKENGNEFSSVF